MTMPSFLAMLKSLIPVIEPMGEQGINNLFSSVVNPYIAAMPDSADAKLLYQSLAPGVQSFLIAEMKKLNG